MGARCVLTRLSYALSVSIISASLLASAGCKTDDGLAPTVDDKKQSAEKPVAAAPTDTGLYNQTMGDGETRVGFLGVRRNDGAGRQADRDYRDGAAFAVNELGKRIVKYTMVESAEKPEAIQTAARSLADQGVKLIMTTARGSELSMILVGLAGRPIPIIAFLPNDAARPPGVYAFVSSPADSVLEGATYAMAEGAKSAAILAGSAAETPEADRIAASLKAFGGKADVILDASAGLSNPKQLAAWKKTDMVIVMPGVRMPGNVLKAFTAGEIPKVSRRIVASTAQSQTDLADTTMTGSIVCRYDYNVNDRLGKRYLATYGLPVSNQAAYGFDAMAMAIGLAGHYGDDPFAQPILTQEQGFSGVLGVFRLEQSGRVRRNCDIFKAVGGRYVFVQRAPQGL
jgi:phosphoribosylcarboxyaminoimidazole (NCAIR) mutase